MRVLCGDLQRGDGFQAGLDALLLPAVPDPELGGALPNVLPPCLGPVDGSFPAAAELSLAALGALLPGGRGLGTGGGQRLEPPHRNEREQTVGLLLGVEREVAEDVLVLRGGRSRRSGGRAAPLILEQEKKYNQIYFSVF